MSLKVLYSVLSVGKCSMEVTVQDQEGSLRRIALSWQAKVETDVPPSDWLKQVEAEVGYQRSRDADEAAGRIVRR